MKKKFTFLMAALMLLTMMVLPGKAVGQTFKRISSSSTLSDGDQIIFVNQNENLACSTTQNSNNRGTVSISTSSNKYTKTNSDNVQVFTVKINDDGEYGFHTGTGYLYSKSSSKNQINTITTAITTLPSGTSAWTLESVSSNVFTFKNATNTSYYLAFNESNSPKIFAQYTSGYIKPYIYERAYTVTYNAGGGTGTMTDTDSPYTSGETVSLMDNTFTRDDYEFSGWLVKDELNNEVTVTEGDFTMPRGNVTVTAQWTPATTDPYFDVDNVDLLATATTGTIAYKVNNSVSGGKISAACTAGDSWISAVTVTDEDSDDSTVTFTTSVNAEDERIGTIRLTYTYDSDKTKTADVTITQAIAQYTVTYNANDGTTEDVVITYDYGTDVTVFDYDDDEIDFTPPTGKRFKNWKENSTTYDAGDEISSIDANHILVAQWEDLPTYSLVTSDDDLICGMHYIIVGSKTTKNYAMGAQGTNNRSAVEVTIDNNTIEAVTGIYEFVISGPETIKKNDEDVIVYTIYDVAGDGYLYAASSSDNYLRKEATLDDNGKWAIAIDATTHVATITAQGTNSRNKLKKNNSSDIFSCYSSGQNDVYLYKKDGDNDCHIYSNTTLNDDMTVTGSMNIHSGVVTVGEGSILTVNGTFTNAAAANLVIEDGGQLICSNSVAATVKKSIANANEKDPKDHWYTISAPVHTGSNNYLTIGASTTVNLTNNGAYDMFAYDEPTHYWLNQKSDSGATGFDKMYAGQGYMYRNSGNELSYVGNTTVGPVNIALSYTSTLDVEGLKGFNLIGNPYTHSIAKGVGKAIDNSKLSSGCYALTNSGTWTIIEDGNEIKPNQGVLVEVSEAVDNFQIKDINYVVPTPDPGKYKNDNIKFIVESSDYSDAAYAWFDKGIGLTKINHRNENAPMLYIPQDNNNYAIATMSDDTKVFGLNFKAATMGQYTLSYKADGNFDYLHIIDRLTGKDIDMLLEGQFTFMANKNDSENRFIVKLGYSPDYSEGNNDIFAYQTGSEILVSGSGELQIFDVTGRKVMTTTINGAESISVPAQGVYIFRLVGNEVKTQKIVVR